MYAWLFVCWSVCKCVFVCFYLCFYLCLCYHIVSWEPEGRYCNSKMFRWEPEGHYCRTKCTTIATFWLSMQHLWSAITPFWLSTCVYVHAYLRVCQYFFSMYRCIWMYFSSCVYKLKMTHSIYPMMHGWDYLWTRKPRLLVQSHPSIIVITPPTVHSSYFSSLRYTLLALFTNIYKQGEIFKYL